MKIIKKDSLCLNYILINYFGLLRSSSLFFQRLRRFGQVVYSHLIVYLFAIGLSACSSTSSSLKPEQFATKQEYIAAVHIVDCLLPGQIRRLGGTTYVTSRRPIKTTAADCNIRGGEYVEYDRANYKTSLAVWLPAAEGGDAEAQVNVGQIFERGLGGEPNYEAAAIWYEKAARQNNRRGQFNLGTLYEQGLGVKKDRVKALNFYRQAWDLPDDHLIYQSAASRQQRTLNSQNRELETRLNRELRLKDDQIRQLEGQIQDLESKLQGQIVEIDESAYAQLEIEIVRLKERLNKLNIERGDVHRDLTSLPAIRTVEASDVTDEQGINTTPLPAEIKGLQFGRFYALVIGNQDYQLVNDLSTTKNDAIKMAELLKEKYGFKVQLLINADRVTVAKAIIDLNDKLTEKDNLLIYYAGHGIRNRSKSQEIGYWLPVNAQPPPNDAFWVANDFVTRYLDQYKAKRVLVVADSCYAGLLSSSPSYTFFNQEINRDIEFIKSQLSDRARLLITSGGDKPVIDTGGRGHSVFARVLLDALRQNKEIISAPELFLSIRDRVEQLAKANQFDQTPDLKVIKDGGHEMGGFYFVPSGT